MENYNKAIELSPNDAVFYSNRGLVYSKLERYDKAIEDFNKAIKLDPSNPITYDNRGVHFAKLEQYDKAMEDYNKAIELDPNYINAIMNISELRIITGDYEGALESATKGLSLQLEINYTAIILYLECITKKLLNMETPESEVPFNEILKKDFIVTWGFEMLESWLEGTDIDDDKKKYIIEKTEVLKKHVKK